VASFTYRPLYPRRKSPFYAPDTRLGGPRTDVDVMKRKKKDWGNLVPRINVENGINLGFLLE
jgi:hypothetical protein